VHLSVASDAVRRMTESAPANDPLSLQATHHETLPLPAASPPEAAHQRTITLREQELIVTILQNVIKEVTIRRERTTGEITISEPVKRDTMQVEAEETPEEA